MKEPNKDLLYALPEELSTTPRTPRLPQTKRPDAQKGHMKSLVFTVRLPGHMGVSENEGPFWGTLNTTQKGTIILTTTHI